MNLFRRLVAKTGMVKLKPHEKAELGISTWGRQTAKAEPKPAISARIIRKDGTIEDLGVISKPKEE